MSFLDAATVAGIRASVAGLFWDTAVIQTRDTTADKSGCGDQVENFTNGSPTPCKLNISDSSETPDWQELVKMTGTIMFPSGTVIGSHDRISVTHKYGTALSPAILFLVSGEPYISLLGVVVPVEIYPK